MLWLKNIKPNLFEQLFADVYDYVKDNKITNGIIKK